MDDGVLVVVGIGGMGEAIVRASGAGHRVLLADVDEEALETTAATLREAGHDVIPHQVDVADPASVSDLAAAAATLGPVRSLAHTAGLSPVQATAERIVAVDLLGVAYALEAFAEVIAPGGAGVIISSNSGYLVGPLPAEQEADAGPRHHRRTGERPLCPGGDRLRPRPGLRLRQAHGPLPRPAGRGTWGGRQARINSISPGIISTPMGEEELAGPHGEGMRQMVAASAAGRTGTPEEIAAATAFLLGPAASFVTGTDLLVDGGMVAALLTPPPA